MRKVMITICCVLIFGLLATTIFLRTAVNSREVGMENPSFISSTALESSSNPTFNDSSSSHSERSYILKAYEGKLAVFQSGADNPYRITDVRISSLPVMDQQALQEGIEAKNEKELSQLLNDFCS